MITTTNLEHWLAACQDIAIEAGHEIMDVYGSDFEVEHKQDESPVTEADLRAHRVIEKRLKALTPDIPILSEEEKALPFEVRQTWETYWLVDPLDGTREFVKRNDEFTVNIALIHQHNTILGVVYTPVLETLYFAAEGLKAWRRQADTPKQAIQCRVLDDQHLRLASSRSHANETLQAFVARLGEHESFPMGSSLKFCIIAEGKADLYPRLGLTSEWDTAAAQCVVEQAGGQVTDTQMRPLKYNTKDSLLNPHFFVFGAQSRDWSKYLSESQ